MSSTVCSQCGILCYLFFLASYINYYSIFPSIGFLVIHHIFFLETVPKMLPYHRTYIDFLESNIDWKFCHIQTRAFYPLKHVYYCFHGLTSRSILNPLKTVLIFYYTVHLPVYLSFLFLPIPSCIFVLQSEIIFLLFWRTPLSSSFIEGMIVTNTFKSCLSKNVCLFHFDFWV